MIAESAVLVRAAAAAAAAVAVVGYFELTSTKRPAFGLLYTMRIVLWF